MYYILKKCSEQHTCRQGRMASPHFFRLPTHRDGSTGSVYKTDFCRSCATFPLYQLWLEISKALKETASVSSYTSMYVKMHRNKNVYSYSLILIGMFWSKPEAGQIPKKLTEVQLTENSVGLMNFNWYIILHTTITQAQTEDTVEATGRSLAYGTANVQDARKTKFISDTYITKREKHLWQERTM